MYYFLLLIVKIITALLCYLTNWFVVIFADEYGQLPKIFKLWQTYDNCLDIDWMIDEKIVPAIFRYNFHKHYIYHPENKSKDKMIPGYVEIIDPNFTFKEKIQRYFCRIAWLYRNNAYGFSYYWLGKEINYDNQIVIKNIKTNNQEIYFSYIKKKDKKENKWAAFYNFFLSEWCFYYHCPYNKTKPNSSLRCYLGWKFKFSSEDIDTYYCQYALSINPFKQWD